MQRKQESGISNRQKTTTARETRMHTSTRKTAQSTRNMCESVTKLPLNNASFLRNYTEPSSSQTWRMLGHLGKQSGSSGYSFNIRMEESGMDHETHQGSSYLSTRKRTPNTCSGSGAKTYRRHDQKSHTDKRTNNPGKQKKRKLSNARRCARHASFQRDNHT